MSKKNMFKQLSITNYFKVFSKTDSVKNDDQLRDIKIESHKEDNCIINIKSIRGYNEDTGNWHCLDCGENMGDNPRQLCGKSRCLNIF